MSMIRSKHFHRSLLCLVTCGLLLILGCGKNPAGPTSPIPFETIYKGSTAPYPIGSLDPFQGAIRDEAGWRALWTKYFTTAPLPVDFSQQMVLAIVLRISPCGNNEVEIQTVEDMGGKWVAQAIFWLPPDGTICLAANPANLCHIVKVPRTDLPVEFTLTQKMRS